MLNYKIIEKYIGKMYRIINMTMYFIVDIKHSQKGKLQTNLVLSELKFLRCLFHQSNSSARPPRPMILLGIGFDHVYTVHGAALKCSRKYLVISKTVMPLLYQ